MTQLETLKQILNCLQERESVVAKTDLSNASTHALGKWNGRMMELDCAIGLIESNIRIAKIEESLS